MLAAIACLVCLALGAGVAAFAYERELRRMARFLSERDERSNARMTVEAPGPGFLAVARAVNETLDDVQRSRIDDLRRQRAFQRDLSALSHDVRTPLMGAKGRLQLAQDTYDDQERNTQLNSAMERLDEAVGLINQLFAYTKASDPDFTLELEPVALMPAVVDALARRQPAFEAAGWEPAVDFEDEGATTLADAPSLVRVFDNLVDNALKHGTSTLTVRQQGGRLSFSNEVANPEAIEVDRLLERFYRADAARSGAGSGLGLAVAASLATAMGMSLRAELDGATLSIVLEANQS